MFRTIKAIAKIEGLIFKRTMSFGVIKFNLPDLGEKIKQGTIKKLYIKEGDKVQQFQKLADVASDKQFTEITAADSGVIKKIYYLEEDTCQVGELFLQIQVQDAQQENNAKQQNETKKSEKTISQNNNNDANLEGNEKRQSFSTALASPFVRGLIKKNNMNIDEIQGTGPQGRITQDDVKAILQGKRQPKRTPSIQFGIKSKPKQSTITSITTQETSKSSPRGVSSQQQFQVKKMSLFQKGMQKSMTIASTIPHLYFHQQIDLTECEKLRKTLKNNNKKVTVMGLLIKTFSLALKKYPKMNSVYSPQLSEFQYKVHANHNISIAIDSPNGLVVPNIKKVQTLNLLNIQEEIQRLKNLAIAAKLTGAQLNNGTISISNIGTIGGILTNPLILTPQVCIVGVGKLQTVARFKEDKFVPRNVINISFGCDHRVLDGATVARFSSQWKTLLQNPYLALAQMI